MRNRTTVASGLFRVPAVLLFLVLFVQGVPAGAADPAARPKIVASTSLIAEIAADLLGTAAEITTLIPPASCPGHYDLRPEDLKRLSAAQLFLLHDWQGDRFGEPLLRAAANPALQRVVLAVPGTWMVPAVQARATERIAGVLAEAWPLRREEILAAARRRVTAVHRAESRGEARLASVRGGAIAVLADAMQADFVRWAGLTVAGVFGRGEEMTPAEFAQAVRDGRRAGVRLVVENLQSGNLAGRAIARELGVPAVTLSNFPGGFPGTETWEKAFAHNVSLLAAGLAP
ncbi:MAG: metal ABC transporter substrate-binding protein [Desulfobacterales bacterium]